MAPRVIAIEGPDGAGKSTIAKGLSLKLSNAGYLCDHVHSPGATSVGKDISEIIYRDVATRKAASFLYMADFAQLTAELASNNLDYIIMDRHSCYSELVYSGIIDDAEMCGLMLDIYFKYMGCSKPSYTYVLNIPYEIARSRILNIDPLRVNNFIDSKFVNDEEWGRNIVRRYELLSQHGGVLAATSVGKWMTYSPTDWVDELYDSLMKEGVVA
jgi:thymidylate kinase